MNRHVVGALFEDAFRQVLDDKVFRLLVGIAILLILPTFVLGFRAEGVSLLFGWKTWTYDELSSMFGGTGGQDPQAFRIGQVQGVIVNGLAGTVGLLFCIAATAFFVPRMLEKGAADTLFSKPVGRFALLAARYAAGVFFVGILSFLLVLGMHAGFLLTSGMSDPAFLWSALTLTYVFALVHSVSVAVAVFTRSSIAAILTTLIFFVFTGCIQGSWIQVEHRAAIGNEAAARGEEEVDVQNRFGFLIATLDTLHWVLPKTSDADFVVAGLRRTITATEPSFRDENGFIAVGAEPAGLVREGPAAQDLGTTPVVWTKRDDAGVETARIALSRRSRVQPAPPAPTSAPLNPTPASTKEPSGPASGKTRLRSPGTYASDYAKKLVDDKIASDKPARSNPRDVGDLDVSWVRWRERAGDADVERAHGFAAVEDALYEVDVRFTASFGTGDERQKALDGVLKEVRIERESAENMRADEWYTRTFGWTSPFRHNAFVSIGTSLLFALLLMLVAWWRLTRIDF